MKVANRRWGEVTIKKQGEKKNKFDQTKSFSIIKSDHEYSIEELKDIFEITVNLTEKYKYDQLKKNLIELSKEKMEI